MSLRNETVLYIQAILQLRTEQQKGQNILVTHQQHLITCLHAYTYVYIYNKTGNLYINVTLRCSRATTVAVVISVGTVELQLSDWDGESSG